MYRSIFAGCHCVVIEKVIIVVTTQLACVMSVFGEINNISLFSFCFASPATYILSDWMTDAVRTSLHWPWCQVSLLGEHENCQKYKIIYWYDENSLGFSIHSIHFCVGEHHIEYHDVHSCEASHLLYQEAQIVHNKKQLP